MDGVHDLFELSVNTAVGKEIKMKEEREKWAAGGAGEGNGGRKKLRRRGCPIL